MTAQEVVFTTVLKLLWSYLVEQTTKIYEKNKQIRLKTEDYEAAHIILVYETTNMKNA